MYTIVVVVSVVVVFLGVVDVGPIVIVVDGMFLLLMFSLAFLQLSWV